MTNGTESFRSFQFGSLTVVEIPLTKAEIENCLELGSKRTELDEKVLGWKYRHHGKSSERAHGIGFIGETAFEKWLQSRGLKEDRDYIRADPFVARLEDIRQDYTIGDSAVGTKTAENPSLEDATRYGSFLYPAKKDPGESKRVLDYPDFLIQTVADIPGTRCWLCGFVDKATIMEAPIHEVKGKPAHFIPISQYRPVEELVQILKAENDRSTHSGF